MPCKQIQREIVMLNVLAHSTQKVRKYPLLIFQSIQGIQSSYLAYCYSEISYCSFIVHTLLKITYILQQVTGIYLYNHRG